MIPNHVVRHLIAQGHLDPNGVSRHARPRTCPKCHRLVIVGLDHDRSALVATVDPQPLAPQGELAALFDGKRTYALRANGDAYTVDMRETWNITNSPAGTKSGVDVVAEHSCSSREYATIPSLIAALPAARKADAECPF